MMRHIAGAVAVVVIVLSVQPAVNLLSSRQIMNSSFDPLDLVNTYGAFGTVGRERFDVVFEGTDDDPAADDAVWKEYRYRALPVDIDRRPVQIAPYQPRLDWQMWFASMSTADRYPWTLNLVWKLLHNDPQTLRLFADNPFPDHPPRSIRAVQYRYRFAPPGNPEGKWWIRERLGLWLPALSADNDTLRRFLVHAGWLPADLGV